MHLHSQVHRRRASLFRNTYPIKLTTIMTSKTGYASIPDPEQASQLVDDDEPPRSSSISRSSIMVLRVGSFILVGILLLFAVGDMSLNGQRSYSYFFDKNDSIVDMEGASRSNSRACKFEECYDTKCNAATAPHTCLFHNGGPHGGCSSTPWTPETCDDQCDLSKCEDLAIPDTVKSCKGIECGKEWCSVGQVCPKDVSFQCMDGSARFGCSTDALQWTLKTDVTTCSGCCDTTTCT